MKLFTFRIFLDGAKIAKVDIMGPRYFWWLAQLFKVEIYQMALWGRDGR